MMVLKVVFAAVLVASVSAKLPDYIEPCSLSDAKFAECFIKNAQHALPHLLKGVPELKIPVIYSFKPGTLDLDPSENLHFHSENGATTNSKYDVFDVSYDQATRLLKFVLRTGHNEWAIDFIANGTLADKPVLEKGNAKLILDNADIHYEAKLDIKEVDGVKHFAIDKHLKSDTTIEKFEFQTIDQESVNEKLTAEQKKAWDETLPLFKQVMANKVDQLGGPLITHVLNMVFSLVPANEVFLP